MRKWSRTLKVWACIRQLISYNQLSCEGRCDTILIRDKTGVIELTSPCFDYDSLKFIIYLHVPLSGSEFCLNIIRCTNATIKYNSLIASTWYDYPCNELFKTASDAWGFNMLIIRAMHNCTSKLYRVYVIYIHTMSTKV